MTDATDGPDSDSTDGPGSDSTDEPGQSSTDGSRPTPSDPDSVDDVRDLIGWAGPGFAVPVERGRIRDFAAATFCDDPVFRDVAEARSRGYADLPAPPTLFGTLFYYERGVHQPALPFDSRRTLHGEQSFAYERTPVANETLYAKTRVTDAFEKGRSNGGTLTGVVMETTFRDADGDLVQTAEKTVVEVGGGDRSSDVSEAAGPKDDGRAATDGGRVASGRHAVGDDLPTRSRAITRQDVARYGGASGDFNRPHVDEPFALEAGYDAVIAHGMLTAGIGGTCLHEWFGVDSLRSYAVRFEDVVRPGDELAASGTIVDRAGDAVVAEVVVETGDGRAVLSGTVEAVIPRVS